MSVSTVSLPSLVNKSEEIKHVKNENKHADMKFTFSNPDYSGLGDKFKWAKSCIIISFNYGENYKTSIASPLGKGSIARFAVNDYYEPIKQFINILKNHFDDLNIKTHEFIDNPSHFGDKLGGVIAMFSAIFVLFLLPWLDTSKVRSATFRPIYKILFWIFLIDALILGWVGSKPAEGIYIIISRIATFYYFLHFLILLPLLGKFERNRPLPESIGKPVLAE